MDSEAVLSDAEGSDPSEPVNITKRIRLDHNYGLATFAEFAGISSKHGAHTILRVDQGTYRNIPGEILRALMRLEPQYPESVLQDEYRKYVKANRRWSCEKQPFALYTPRHLAVQPLQSLRRYAKYYTVMGFCTAFSLHPSTIRRFEQGTTVNVPEQVKEFLYDLDYNSEDVAKLQEWHDKWRSR